MFLEMENLTKRYSVPAGDVVAVDDVSLHVEKGEFITLLGPSGSGKTTFLHLVDGLIPRTAGTIRLEGRPLNGIPREMAMVFQDIALLPWRSVVQNVEIGLEASGVGKKERRTRSLEALERVGLRDWADSPPYRLSGGMQQRVGFARALVGEPQVLLLDEPFGQLDNFTRETLQVELEALCEELNMTVLFVTHDVNEAIILGDRVGLFREGHLVRTIPVPLERPRRGMAALADNRTAELRQTILTELGVGSPSPGRAPIGARE